MSIQDVVVEIDAEISRLQQVKAILTGSTPNRKSGPLAAAGLPPKARKRRRLSAEARARIAAAQKARWAKFKTAAKKAASPKVAKKSAPTKKVVLRTKSGASKAKIPAALACISHTSTVKEESLGAKI